MYTRFPQPSILVQRDAFSPVTLPVIRSSQRPSSRTWEGGGRHILPPLRESNQKVAQTSRPAALPRWPWPHCPAHRWRGLPCLQLHRPVPVAHHPRAHTVLTTRSSLARANHSQSGMSKTQTGRPAKSQMLRLGRMLFLWLTSFSFWWDMKGRLALPGMRLGHIQKRHIPLPQPGSLCFHSILAGCMQKDATPVPSSSAKTNRLGCSWREEPPSQTLNTHK